MGSAILFGINGQDGYYLSRLLAQNGISITGISRTKGDWVTGDVSDKNFVEQLIKELQPAYIFHLAANSKTAHELVYEHQSTIVNGSMHILESVYKHSPRSRVFITGSGLQFDNNGSPVSEHSVFEARDAYSLARIQSVYAARYYRYKGLKVYVGYLFHHDSPLRSSVHLNKKIADAAIAARDGKAYSLTIGDISVEKEFGFAGDIAKGIFHLVNQDHISEACIGTGKAYSIERWLELCFSLVGKNWKEYIQTGTNYKSEFTKLVSDSALLQSSGWKPMVTIEELADMMVNPVETH